VNGYRKGLKKRSSIERDMIRDPTRKSAFVDQPSPKMKAIPVTPFGRMIYPLLKRALEMWYALGTTSESHLFAQIVAASSADATFSTGNADLESDSITNSEISYLGSNGDDNT
jgi:hypothetical protein